jgi:hypothetical protein
VSRSRSSFAWDELHPATAPPLTFTGAAYDSRRGRIVGFGGFLPDSAVSNTWALTLGVTPAWIDLGHSPAGARYQHVAAYDSTGDRLLVVDGFYFDGNTRFRFDDAWQLDLSGTPVWTSLAALGNAPAPFNSACGIFDEAQHRLVVFGGRRDDATSSNETHTLSFPRRCTDVDKARGLRSVATSGPRNALRCLRSARVEAAGDRRVGQRVDGRSPVGQDARRQSGALGDRCNRGNRAVFDSPPVLGTTVVGPTGYDASRSAFRTLLRQDDLAGFELRDEGGLTLASPAAGGKSRFARQCAVVAGAGPVDPVSGRAYAFTGDSLYVLADGDPDTWTRTVIVPPLAGAIHGGMVWLDAPRNRWSASAPGNLDDARARRVPAMEQRAGAVHDVRPFARPDGARQRA